MNCIENVIHLFSNLFNVEKLKKKIIDTLEFTPNETEEQKHIKDVIDKNEISFTAQFLFDGEKRHIYLTNLNRYNGKLFANEIYIDGKIIMKKDGSLILGNIPRVK